MEGWHNDLSTMEDWNSKMAAIYTQLTDMLKLDQKKKRNLEHAKLNKIECGEKNE